MALDENGERLHRAATQLVAGLETCRDYPEARLALVKRLARSLGQGSDGYPVLLKLMLMVAELGTVSQRQLLAETLALGLRRGDLPAGAVSMWGSSGATPMPAASLDSLSVGQLQLGLAAAATPPQRWLGPLEYLTAWRFQKTQHAPLAAELYLRSMALLIDLMDLDPSCRALYPAHLRRLAEDAIDGQFTESTRDALRRLADSWESSTLRGPA